MSTNSTQPGARLCLQCRLHRVDRDGNIFCQATSERDAGALCVTSLPEQDADGQKEPVFVQPDLRGGTGKKKAQKGKSASQGGMR